MQNYAPLVAEMGHVCSGVVVFPRIQVAQERGTQKLEAEAIPARSRRHGFMRFYAILCDFMRFYALLCDSPRKYRGAASVRATGVLSETVCGVRRRALGGRPAGRVPHSPPQVRQVE